MTIEPTNPASDLGENSTIIVRGHYKTRQEGDEQIVDGLLEQKAEKEDQTAFAPRWSADAPKGGRVVLARALKESSAVPLFLAQTFVQSLRDVGYNSTTSALCEHVDNAIGAHATEIRVLFRQIGKKGELKTNILVQDNGTGMAPNVLKVATSRLDGL
jgi:Histidine kinase-, DNA gyrase B-, and HSP90-like ATPase